MTSNHWAPAATGPFWWQTGPDPPPNRPAAGDRDLRRGVSGTEFGIVAAMSSSDQTRLLIVEDVPQVAQYIRGLLNAQAHVKLLDVISEGAKAPAQIQQLRPDVVLIDALLQGRMKGPQLVEQIRESKLGVPVIVLTVPQTPIAPDPDNGIHGVLTMPFSGFDLITRIAQVRKDFEANADQGGSRVVSVFAPKGGVGKTTLAFNLAVAFGQLEQRTVLIDGSLQFGDLRALLKVPADAPSILDLPTDRIAESDLGDVLWRDPSGIDILLAPPRIEMAEMVTVRDVDKVLSLLRRIYGAIVIDLSSHLNDVALSFLDASDVILEVVTYDSTTIHNTIAMADTFKAIGYPAAKVHYLVNRADSAGGIDPHDLERALGRVPEHRVVSDGRLVVQANNEGVPFVLAEPGAQISQDIGRLAGELLGQTAMPAAAGRG
jgi:pilus assembly protein CpaE